MRYVSYADGPNGLSLRSYVFIFSNLDELEDVIFCYCISRLGGGGVLKLERGVFLVLVRGALEVFTGRFMKYEDYIIGTSAIFLYG